MQEDSWPVHKGNDTVDEDDDDVAEAPPVAVADSNRGNDTASAGNDDAWEEGIGSGTVKAPDTRIDDGP